MSGLTPIFMKQLGFPEPVQHDAYEAEDAESANQTPTEISFTELEQLTGIRVPSSIRAVHEAHGIGQPHVHFTDERSLNKDGTWERNDQRPLTSDEKTFIEKLGFQQPEK